MSKTEDRPGSVIQLEVDDTEVTLSVDTWATLDETVGDTSSKLVLFEETSADTDSG